MYGCIHDRGAVTLVDRGFAVLHNSPDHVRAAANKYVHQSIDQILNK